MEKPQIKSGMILTIIGTSAMAMTTQGTVMVFERNGQMLYKHYPVKSNRVYFLNITENDLVFEGADTPVLADMEAVKRGLSEIFEGNAMINLYTKLNIEEARVYIDQNNLNPTVDLSQIRIKGVPVFPELCDDLINQEN